jgi:CheY-like chemotaxis protein
VEDDAGDVLLVEEMLADSGMQASLIAVRSLAEATGLLSAGTVPGCVLLDLHLPDVQGLEAVTQILAAAPGAPVVVLTGLAEESAGLAAVAAGAQDYLIKGQAPPDVFGRAIRYATQRKHVEQASAALQRSALRAEENARLERALLPTPLLRTGAFEMVARYRPGRTNALLGGDFYDVVETSDGIVHAVIGDVCGHGAAEAAIGVCLRVAWRSLVLAGATPAALMGLLEQLLMAEREDDHLFATLTHLVFGLDQRSVRVLRAGHPGLLLRTPGHVELVEGPAGPAVGLESGVSWPEQDLPRPRSCPAGYPRNRTGTAQPGRGPWPAALPRPAAAARRGPGAVHRRAVRGPGRPGQPAAGRGRAAGHGPRPGWAVPVRFRG